MRKPGELQKPVKAGKLRKDQTACPGCGALEADRVNGVMYHKPGCTLYARKAPCSPPSSAS